LGQAVHAISITDAKNFGEKWIWAARFY
jgi:hypothetical protein